MQDGSTRTSGIGKYANGDGDQKTENWRKRVLKVLIERHKTLSERFSAVAIS